MELPDLVRESLGEEEVVAGRRLGEDDLVVFTPTRAVLYRGEGLLSDEGITTYPFDFERLQAKRGRRKVSFAMTYMDTERDFSVPKDHGDSVLEHLIEGRLRVSEVVEPDESVTGVFRFSELTLVVTEGRLLKHVGEYTWDADFEGFDYDNLTKLDFEEGSVATQVVLRTGGGRTERIKAPNQQAGAVRKALQKAVFAYHGVDSLDALNREIEPEDAEEGPDAEAGLGLDAGIDPLVSDDGDEAEPETAQSPADPGTGTGQQADGGATAGTEAGQGTAGAAPDAGGSGTNAAGGDAGTTSATEDEFAWPGEEEQAPSTSVQPSTTGADEDLQAVTEQLAELTREVERNNELLYRQQQTVEKLIEELRQGR